MSHSTRKDGPRTQVKLVASRRRRGAKLHGQEARENDRELLTPKAAVTLFQRSAEAVRRAILEISQPAANHP